MSAWYVLSSIGFYAVDPVSAEYVLGSPLFDRVTMKLAGGRDLVVEARRESAKSVYIASVELNGKPHPEAWFRHANVAAGGRFAIQMTDRPNLTDGGFGRSAAARPKSAIQMTS